MPSAVHNKAALLQALRQHSHQIRSFGVNKIGLFGSFARDTVKKDSDIDLLVDFEQSKKTFDNFISLSIYLEELLGRDVELVTPQSLNKYLAPFILKETEYVPI